MKLNWFSPLPPAKTDIAHFTTRVLPALASRADVTLWTDQTKWDAKLKHHAEVRSFRLGRLKWAELNRADMCIYNLGNNPLYHGSIWQIARRHAGLVILHDTRLHHFFDGLYRVEWRDLASYLSMMEFYYGEEGRRDAADCFLGDARNINEMAEKYPLTELALENSAGMVVHTEQAFAELQGGARPVVYLPLPFAARPAAGRKLARDEPAGADNRTFRLIVFGYIGRNRRLEAVFKALAEMPERQRFHLDIYGQILDDNEKRFRAQIRELGLREQVTLLGFTPEEKLDQAISRADLAINLRYPTMGEASGGQLRIWAHGLPSLVTKVGWYATLPADTVARVRPDDKEVEDIQTHLRGFLEDRERFVRMGENGRKLLEQQHSPDRYARSLVGFVAEAKRARAKVALYGLAERAGELLGEVVDLNSDGETFERVAAEIRQLARDAT
jgi:glycosyltransferase involved in cell wall biosynthesis